jgi:YbbR domain-containing protein
VNWITTDWRLKLLSVSLGVALLLAVAWSQFPVTTQTVDAQINYNSPPSGLILLGPPAVAKVTLTGLSADIKAAVVTADADLSKIKKGEAVALTPTVRITGSRATVQAVRPLTLTVDDLITRQLDITVDASFVEGWTPTKTQAICGNALQPCQVTVFGPASILNGLAAYVTFLNPINAPSREQLASIVRFRQLAVNVDLGKIVTVPAIGWQPQTVTAHVEAKQGTEQVQVALVDALPTAPPPAGYHVTAITITPQLITITGSPDVIGNINQITLNAVSLAGLTSDHTFTIRIPSPDPSLQLSATTATVSYSIAKNPAVSPTPSP